MPVLLAHENGSREPDKNGDVSGLVRESKAQRINSTTFLCNSTIRGIDPHAGVYEQYRRPLRTADCAQLGRGEGIHAVLCRWKLHLHGK